MSFRFPRQPSRLIMPLAPFPAFPFFTLAVASASAEGKLALVNLDRLRELLHTGQTQSLCEEWLCPQVTVPPDHPPGGVNGMSGDEQGRFQGLHQEKRRSEWLGGRIAAKVAVLDYLRSRRSQGNNENPLWKPASFPIMTTPTGRPFLAPDHSAYGGEAPYISISHSQKYALAVAAATPCGIDIQVSRTTLLRVKDRFCSPQEETTLTAHLPTLTELERLTLLWAAKEAIKKRGGNGTMPGFLDLEVSHIHSCRPCHSTMPLNQDRQGKRTAAARQDKKCGEEPCSVTDEGIGLNASWSQDTADDAPCSPVSFSFLMQFNPEWRKEAPGPAGISVTVGLHQGYGLALCLFPAQDENGENNA